MPSTFNPDWVPLREGGGGGGRGGVAGIAKVLARCVPQDPIIGA